MLDPVARPKPAHLRRVLLLLAGAALLGGCADGTSNPAASPSPSPPPLQAAVANSEVVVGKDVRLAIGILDTRGVPVPDATVKVQVVTVPAPNSGQTARALSPVEDAPYRGAGLDGKGVYVVHQTFETPGFYSVLVQAVKGSESATTRASFQVLATSPTPAIGGDAPRTNNPTAEVSDLSTIDTGVPPDDMHYTSVAAAIAAHHPVAVYFGSPGFCASKLCAPEVNVLKSLETVYHPRGIDFVHIETYKGGRPDNTDLSKATISPFFDEWKLTSDPWVFIVDRNGKVAAKFDGPVEAGEFTPILDQVSSPA